MIVKISKRFTALSLVLVVFLFTSCLSNKKLIYFSALRDSSFVASYKDLVPKIQKGDILFIAVNSADAKSSLLFSSPNSIAVPGVNATGTAIPTNGFLVENDGTIFLPKIGKIMALGKTKYELTNAIQDSLLAYLKDPVVNIRFMNFRVTILGEVSKPGLYTSTNEKMSLPELLGLCGDLTALGNRNNILLLRDSANITISRKLNINNQSLLSSPYYYLQSNDVVYIEPINQKGYSTSQAIILIPVITGVISSLLLVLNFLKK
jgi:polysaccharide export outer membrane protein